MNPFPPNSRYHASETAMLPAPEGKKEKGHEIIYLKRRFLPDAAGLQTIHQHEVSQGDRLDNLAARYFGDPEQFWRICDANFAQRPEDLTETVGRILDITLPEHLPAPPPHEQ